MLHAVAPSHYLQYMHACGTVIAICIQSIRTLMTIVMIIEVVKGSLFISRRLFPSFVLSLAAMWKPTILREF